MNAGCSPPFLSGVPVGDGGLSAGLSILPGTCSRDCRWPREESQRSSLLKTPLGRNSESAPKEKRKSKSVPGKPEPAEGLT